jgi:hypothetical protein
VLRVEEPAARGAQRLPGVLAEIGFVDPAGGREIVGVNRQGRLDAAWVGREVEVRFPPGKPEKFRVVAGAGEVDRELARPATLFAVAAVALIARAATGPGMRWLVVGFCALWTLVNVHILVSAIRRLSYRRARLTAPAQVTGRIVALLENRSSGDDGMSSVTYTPVVRFTTLDGLAVTGVCQIGGTSRRQSLGRELPLRYAPDDPSVFEPDQPGDRAGAGCGLFVAGLFFLVGIAITGAAAMLVPVG